ncbi:MAG: metalloregulator ArsR/SmtB family transcription factor [Gemmatimonadaceae bacterium]
MTTPSLDHVYSAIADPTRRAILVTLRRGEMKVGDVAAAFPISFNGVSKHVKVLERAGLVARRVEGREHWLRLRAAPLRAASRWLDDYRLFWEGRLAALEATLLAQDAKDARRTRRGR